MAIPSASYSTTVRLEVPADPTSVGRLTTAVGSAGGAVTALDVTESYTDRIVVDVTCAASDQAHAEQLTEAPCGSPSGNGGQSGLVQAVR